MIVKVKRFTLQDTVTHFTLVREIRNFFSNSLNHFRRKPAVAIPSNRVNVSYYKVKFGKLVVACRIESQSPQIGSMFFTAITGKIFTWLLLRRNPLKSGQCFLQHPSFFTHYRKLNTPFAGTSLFLCFLFPYLTYLLP